jgi:hypothetical protein
LKCPQTGQWCSQDNEIDHDVQYPDDQSNDSVINTFSWYGLIPALLHRKAAKDAGPERRHCPGKDNRPNGNENVSKVLRRKNSMVEKQDCRKAESAEDEMQGHDSSKESQYEKRMEAEHSLEYLTHSIPNI